MTQLALKDALLDTPARDNPLVRELGLAGLVMTQIQLRAEGALLGRLPHADRRRPGALGPRREGY